MTRHELRCSDVNNTLFEITQDMPEELKSARLGIFKDKNADERLTNELSFLDDNNIIKKYNFRPYDQNQSFFLVIKGEKFIKENHPVAVINTIVEKLDLNILYSKYSNEGNPSYHPKMMLKILFYAYYDGIMSCRTIWDAVMHRYDFIYLAAGEVPDFRTVNRFRLENLDILPAIFTQIVLLCKELEMIDFKNLAIDGEKIQANASYKNSKNLKGIEKEYDKIKEGIKKLLRKEINEYFTEEKKRKKDKYLRKEIREIRKI